MNWKEFITGIVLYFLPITLFIVSVAVIPNALWVAISVTWIFASILYKVILIPDTNERSGKSRF